MANQHMLKSFDDALSGMAKNFGSMGALVADNCAMAAQAFLEADSDLALKVVNRDLDVDILFEQMRAACFDVLVRFQPVARDLRLVMGIEHAVGDLERAGDHAKNIAKRLISNPSRKIEGQDALQIGQLAEHVIQSLRLAVAAVSDRNTEDAKSVIVADAMIDARHDAIFDSVMVQLRQLKADAPWLVQRLFVAKSLERIGDHATNIGEEVLFLTRGMPPGATRTGGEMK